MMNYIVLLIKVHFLVALAAAIEITFELPDNANQCFYEDIAKETECTMEFQVVTGGQYDVDVELESATGQKLYKEIRKQYDSFTWKAESTGSYKVCFSNEFSTFSHKIIYFHLQIGDEQSVVPTKASMVPLTMMESASVNIHEKLKVVDDLQTHQRLRELTGRKSAEDLNDRVLYWSLGQTAVLLVIGVGQVMILKSFFSDKRSARGRF